MELLKKLYEIHSMSGSEKKMRNFIKRYVQTIDDVTVTVDKSGNIYITKGVSDTYPCVAAHIDQVQHSHAKDFKAIETEDIIFGYSKSKKEIQGLGADDKNGIWVALKCLEMFDEMKVAFFVGEEVGCVGSSSADMSFFGDCRFVIEPDRRGSSDLITDISGTELCSKEFLSAICPENYGYKETHGLMTDVMELKQKGLGVSCINLSCGYYDPHTDNEYTVKADLWNCLYFVVSIIRNCTEVYAHEYKVSESYGMYGGYSYYGSRYYHPHLQDYDTLYDYCFDLVCDYPEKTPDELWDMERSELSYWGITKSEFIDECKQARFYWGYDEEEEYDPYDRFMGSDVPECY